MGDWVDSFSSTGSTGSTGSTISTGSVRTVSEVDWEESGTIGWSPRGRCYEWKKKKRERIHETQLHHMWVKALTWLIEVEEIESHYIDRTYSIDNAMSEAIKAIHTDLATGRIK